MTFSDALARMRRIGLSPEALHTALALAQAAGTSPDALLAPYEPTHPGQADPAPPAVDAHPPPPAQLRLRRVVEVQREHLLLHDGVEPRRARVLPRLLAALADDDDALAVGDWVLVRADPHGADWVHHRVPPQRQLARRQHDGREKVARAVIVSNVDTALLTMGLDLDFNLRRLERYATLARLAGVQAVAVLTKADRCASTDEREARVAQAQARLGAEVPVLAVDGQQPGAVDALRPWLGLGRTLVLLGASGAGKSTLTNTLCAEAVQAIGGTRTGDGRGRHTTTVRSLHVTPHGACIIDTPGLRTWRLDTDEAALDGVFSDVSGLADQCRFRNCRHQGEPGCAVQAGVAPDRLRHFHKLRREAERDTMSALERQRQLSEWKARGRAGRARADAKRR